MTKIGVIGQGFVGGSLTTVLSERGNEVYVYDKAGIVAEGGISVDFLRLQNLAGLKSDKTAIQFFAEYCESEDNFSKLYFVCVPTPMWDDGECDLSIVERVLNELASIPGERTAIIKSTIPPGTTERFNAKFANTGLKVVFCPEFLTEANALDDMRNQTRIIVGGPRPAVNSVVNMFKSSFPETPVIKTSSTIAEMVKYFTNIQLAARVVLSCEFWQLCNTLSEKGLDIDYDKVVEYARYDSRLGNTHMSVPGHDGVPGARGHCVLGSAKVLMKNKNSVLISELYESFSNETLISTDHLCQEINLKKIAAVVKNPYKGKLLKFKVNGKEFTCTPEHLMPIQRADKVMIVKAEQVQLTDKLFVYDY